ncbi:MAG: hypothetical protein R6V86_07075, partial [Spirochaetia bacterium]
MTREFYLLSIIPNQHTRLKLQSLRHRLFQQHGLASALVFEPVIPLAWFEAPVDSGGYARFSTGTAGLDNAAAESTGEALQLPGTPRVELGEPMLRAGHLYIGVVVRPENLLQELINAAGQAPFPAAPVPAASVSASPVSEGGFLPIPAAPFPATEGIFLAANELEIAKEGRAGPENRERADLMQTAKNQIAQLTPLFSADRSLESTRIGMYSMRFSPDFRRWW